MANMSEVLLSFDDVSIADANRYANELREVLLDSSSDVEVTMVREDPQAQDFGSALLLVLATPAVVALAKGATPTVVAVAKGIENWLVKRNMAKVTIKTAEGEVLAEGLSSKDAKEVIQIALEKANKF